MTLNDFIDLCGWKHLPHEVTRIQGLQKHPTLKIAGAVTGLQAKKETTLLFPNLVKILGSYPVLQQAIGDCTSFGMAGAINVLKAVQIVLNNTHEDWKGLTATEPIYGISRIDIGQGQMGEADNNGNNDGSCGAWIAETVKTYGTLIKAIYGNYDLTNYSGSRAREWGNTGVPKELKSLSHEHIVKTITRVTSVEETIASITNGYPVTLSCNQGFHNVRDKDGFSFPEGVWPHQQYIDSYRTDIEGFLVINSWGPKWISGPKAYDQPDGSYWIKAEVLDDIYNRRDSDGNSEADCWNISNFDGYPPQELNLEIV